MSLSNNHAKPFPSKPLPPKTLAFLTLFLLIGVVATVTFATNIRAMLLLHAISPEKVNSADFEGTVNFREITELMITRLISPIPEGLDSDGMDLFKLTALHVRNNNNLALWLAVTEVALVNFLGVLRRIPKLRVAATLFFGVMALASPIVFLLSSSYAGF